MTELTHSLPGIGDEKINLYEPAKDFYQLLYKNKEVKRLNELRHLGAQSRTFQGARHARWDYTMAMLYYIQQLQISGFNSKFRIGGANFSSAKSALQTLALAWNVGHLPGTFAVEKGVFRFFYDTNRLSPSDLSTWKFMSNPRVVLLHKAGENLLREDDYRAMSRVLAVSKLLNMCQTENDKLFSLIVDFVSPYLLKARTTESAQWSKIDRSFQLVRHLAYLTLDLPFVGLQWSPSIPSLFAQTTKHDGASLFTIDSAIRETLSPVEKAVFDRLYHHSRARHEIAVVSGHIYSHLAKSPDATEVVDRWLASGLFRGLKVGNIPGSKSLRCVGTIKFRSEFLVSSETPSAIESDLTRYGFTDPVVFEYRSWNAETITEPDEIIIDLYSRGKFESKFIGRAIVWLMDKYDDQSAKKSDALAIYRKMQLEVVYADLIAQALQLDNDYYTVRLVPWNLNEFNLLPNIAVPENKGGVWCMKANLTNPIVEHILRDRSSSMPPQLNEKYGKFQG